MASPSLYFEPVTPGDDESIVLRKLATAAQNAQSGGGLTPSGVTPGSYTNADITVDVNGIVTAASNGSTFDPSAPGPIGDITPSTGAFTTLTLTPPNNTTGLTLTGGSITGSGTTPFLSITGTWNTTGSPAGIFANFTNTASGGSTDVIRLQVGGVDVFAIGKDGVFRNNVNCSGNIQAFNNVIAAFGALNTKNQVSLSGEGNGILMLVDTTTFNSFNRLTFGGTTNAYPSIKRSSTIAQARLADDSDFCPLQGQLRTHANAVAETPTPTHTLLIYDASGTGYKVTAVAA